MFGHRHYVSLMRAKNAELRALQALEPKLRSWVTPMLECPARVLRDCESPTQLEAKLDTIIGHLSGWSGRTVLLDFSMLASTTIDGALEIAVARANRLGIRAVPVASLKRGEASPTIVRSNGCWASSVPHFACESARPS